MRKRVGGWGLALAAALGICVAATTPRGNVGPTRSRAAVEASAAQACTAPEQIPGLPSAEEILGRARIAVGVEGDDATVLHFKYMQGAEQNFQSDRPYPPYFSAMTSVEAWFDPGSGIGREAGSMVYPTMGPTRPMTVLSTPRSAFLVQGDETRPSAGLFGQRVTTRPLNAWSVLTEWSGSGGVTVEGTCLYRDFPRIVLTRPNGPYGTERLFLDPESAMPVKMEREEPHYLLGQLLVEYLWSTWAAVSGGGLFPAASFRLADGATEITRTVGELERVARVDAPVLENPDATVAMEPSLPMFLRPDPPDTVRVTDHTFLLVNRGYTQAVSLAADTVWVLDATQGEERARRDHEWIGRLFPGDHPVAVVVTDLAWPHIAGVRYWVAQGATIISHVSSRRFLTEVVQRRWTRAPDLLETRRRQVAQSSEPGAEGPALRFHGVDGHQIRAGGAISLHTIGGIGSEGALMAYVEAGEFLWASDYVQTVDEPSSYAAEVVAGVERAGLTPRQVAAEHLQLGPWAEVVGVNR